MGAKGTGGKPSDREGIAETIAQMAILADGRDWPALVKVFAETVKADYQGLTGSPPVEISAAELVRGWKFLEGFRATHHLVGVPSITVRGRCASATANFTATHVLPEAGEGSLWTIGGTYAYDLVKRGSRWQIRSLKMTPAWQTGNTDLPRLAAARSAKSEGTG